MPAAVGVAPEGVDGAQEGSALVATFFLSMIPIGPPLIWGAATIWLFNHGDTGWAWITPCHWQINADHVAMDHPDTLALDAHEIDALREAMQPYFAEDGITLHSLNHSTWLAHGEILCDLPTASLARACGAKVDRWMPRVAQARSLRA